MGKALLVITLLARACSPLFTFAEEPLNDSPLFAGREKSTAEKQADADFVDEVIRAAGTKERALDELLKRGWMAIEQTNPREAIRRFNQAYLLATDEAEIYWGLGSAEGQLHHCDSSLKLFEMAEKRRPRSARLLSDFGFAHVACAVALRGAGSEPHLVAADKLYRRAIEIDPTSALPYSRLAVLMFFRRDFNEANELVKKSQSLGGEGLDPQFLMDLQGYAN